MFPLHTVSNEILTSVNQNIKHKRSSLYKRDEEGAKTILYTIHTLHTEETHVLIILSENYVLLTFQKTKPQAWPRVSLEWFAGNEKGRGHFSN